MGLARIQLRLDRISAEIQIARSGRERAARHLLHSTTEYIHKYRTRPLHYHSCTSRYSCSCDSRKAEPPHSVPMREDEATALQHTAGATASEDDGAVHVGEAARE